MKIVCSVQQLHRDKFLKMVNVVFHNKLTYTLIVEKREKLERFDFTDESSRPRCIIECDFNLLAREAANSFSRSHAIICFDNMENTIF
jgi:hypothetical protein